jgi:hypothetical protein
MQRRHHARVLRAALIGPGAAPIGPAAALIGPGPAGMNVSKLNFNSLT